MYCSMVGSHYIDMILKSLLAVKKTCDEILLYPCVCVCVQSTSFYDYIQTGSDRLYYPAKNPKTILQCMAGVGMFHMHANVSQLVMSFQGCMKTCLYSYAYMYIYI